MTREKPAPHWRVRQDGYPRALGFSADGATLALATDEGLIRFFGVERGEETGTVQAHAGALTSLAWNPRLPIVASAGEDGAVSVLDLRSESTQVVVEPDRVWSGHLAWNPKGSKLAAAIGRGAVIWGLDGRSRVELPAVESTVTDLAWSPDGERVALACYGGVRIFEAKTGRKAKNLDWQGSMLSLAWSPNGKVIACGCQDNSLHFWRVASGQDSMMSGYPLKPVAIAWSQDSEFLASAGAAEITVWVFKGKGPEGSTPLSLGGHEEPVVRLTFSPVINMLASGCRGGAVRLWAVGELDRAVRHYEHPSPIAELCWGLASEPGSMFLASADQEGTVAVWPFR